MIHVQWSCPPQIYQEMRVRSKSDENPAVEMFQYTSRNEAFLDSSGGLWGYPSL